MIYPSRQSQLICRYHPSKQASSCCSLFVVITHTHTPLLSGPFSPEVSPFFGGSKECVRERPACSSIHPSIHPSPPPTNRGFPARTRYYTARHLRLNRPVLSLLPPPQKKASFRALSRALSLSLSLRSSSLRQNKKLLRGLHRLPDKIDFCPWNHLRRAKEREIQRGSLFFSEKFVGLQRKGGRDSPRGGDRERERTPRSHTRIRAAVQIAFSWR